MCACVCDTVAVGCHTRMHLRLFAVKCWAASQGSGKQPAIQQKQEPTTEKKWNSSLSHCCVREVTKLNVTLSLSRVHRVDISLSRFCVQTEQFSFVPEGFSGCSPFQAALVLFVQSLILGKEQIKMFI